MRKTTRTKTSLNVEVDTPNHIEETLAPPTVTMRPVSKAAVAPRETPEEPKPRRKSASKDRPQKPSAEKVDPVALEGDIKDLRTEIVPQFRPRAEVAPSEKAQDIKPDRNNRSRGRKEKDVKTPAEPAAQVSNALVPEPIMAIEGPSDSPEDCLAAVERDLPGATFRARSASESTPQRAPRRSRGRGRSDAPITAAAAVTVSEPESGESTPRRTGRQGRKAAISTTPPVLLQAPPPPPPTRAVIPTPEDAPQVIHQNGRLLLVRNKQVIPPLFFTFGWRNSSDWSHIREQLKHVATSGVTAIGVHLVFPVDTAKTAQVLAEAELALQRILEVIPHAQVLFRLDIQAVTGWEYHYPKAKYFCEDRELAPPSYSDDEFWGVAEACLRDFCQGISKLEDAESVLGVHLDRDKWHFRKNCYDSSPAATEKFREWLRMRYRNDLVSMRASWFDGSAEFDSVTIPRHFRPAHPNEEFVRTDRRARRVVDYHLFLSDTIVERIGRLAYAVKEESQGRFVVSLSYGFTFEWSHPANGHLALGKLLRTPEIDLLTGPSSSKNWEAGGIASFPGPIDSIALNGKIFIFEEEFRTTFSHGQEHLTNAPTIRTPQDLESVHWRGAGAAMTHNAGLSWSDSIGQGWLNSPAIWKRASVIREALLRGNSQPPPAPDCAVFIDERSLAYLVDDRAFELLIQNVRDAVMLAGMSVGFYLLSDLAHRKEFPDSRAFLFLNAWDIRSEVRGAIKNRLQKEGKLLFWLYAAGLFDGGREALERVREVTGIALRPQPFASRAGTQLVQKKHPLCEGLPEAQLLSGGGLEPSYIAIPEEGMVLGEYTETGLPSFVVRHFDTDKPSESWTSVFLGEPLVTPALIRALGNMAQAHVWNYSDDLVHVQAPCLTIHCATSGVRTIALPDKWSAFNLQTQEWATVDSTHLRFNAIAGQTMSFLVGARLDLEALLQRKLSDIQTVDHIPPRLEDTVRLDELSFDVQIVQLDEFMEESWSEDYADDLLLKPSQLELDLPVLDDNFGRSEPKQRSRRRSRPESKSEPPAPSEGLNVVFRKRT